MKKPVATALTLALALCACEEPTVADDVHHFVDVATGGDHSCAVTTAGQAFCWGRGADGELGNGEVANQTVPARVQSEIVFKSITTGYAHTCALDGSGRAFCWGFNAYFQTGANPANTRIPNPIDGNERFAGVSAGANHTCGVALDGRVLCWGYNRWGQIGSGSTQVAIAAQLVSGNLRARRVSAGGDHTCAIDTANVAYCWGSNQYGQLGFDTDTLYSVIPVPVKTNLRFISIAAGSTHTCAISLDARVYCWGSAEYGEIGDGGFFRPGLPGPATPTPAILLAGASAVSAGVHLSCAVDLTNATSCWGRGIEGQTGSGNLNNFTVRQPLKPFGKFTFTVLAAGGNTHACGIMAGVVYCWGTGLHGQLGRRASTVNILPERISR
jgi:alpha-tubulin suppressor-like RCC1 family protein